MSKGTNLSWNDRLTLIDHFKPSAQKAAEVFGVSEGELTVAQDLRKKGQFPANPQLDVASYSSLFASADGNPSGGTDGISTVTSVKAPSRKTTVTSTKAPESASAPVREAKKRGRKGDNILKAFSSIPATPVPAEAFAKEYGVSLAVLRQSHRFDKVGGGSVRVKKDKASKTLMIWREPTV